MTDKKISALTSATTPLAGTELVPIVQGGVTVKVTSDQLGSALSVLNVANTVGSGSVTSTTGTNQVFYKATNTVGSAYFGVDSSTGASGTGVAYDGFVYSPTGISILVNNGTLAARFDTTGNLVLKVAAKGINFTANTPAAGMTSQLLNWYEEGTWTPNQGDGLTVVGAFSSNGTYVRIGRSVTVKGQVLGATTVAVAAAGVISSNLPFTAASGHAGSMYNAAIAVGGAIAITSTSATAASAITATPSITFTATYQM
jgi:hypothetical protein